MFVTFAEGWTDLVVCHVKCHELAELLSAVVCRCKAHDASDGQRIRNPFAIDFQISRIQCATTSATSLHRDVIGHTIKKETLEHST